MRCNVSLFATTVFASVPVKILIFTPLVSIGVTECGDFFGFSVLADGAGHSLFALFGAGCWLGCLSGVPFMSLLA